MDMDDIPPTHSPAADHQANNSALRGQQNGSEDEDFDLLSRLSTNQEGREGRNSEMKFVEDN